MTYFNIHGVTNIPDYINNQLQGFEHAHNAWIRHSEYVRRMQNDATANSPGIVNGIRKSETVKKDSKTLNKKLLILDEGI